MAKNLGENITEVAGNTGKVIIAAVGNIYNWATPIVGEFWGFLLDSGGKAINNVMSFFNGGNKNNANDIPLAPVTQAIGNSANVVKSQIASMLPPETPNMNEVKERGR